MKVRYLLMLSFLLLYSCGFENNSETKGFDAIDTLEVKNGEVVSDPSSKLKSNLSDTSYNMKYFSGQAEIATYSLKKARYNDLHSGEAVLIFVTEPFLIEEQVKADAPTPTNSFGVLKLNRIDRFNTGVYDYSQFTSVFTPYEKFVAKYPMKITMGSQDWCGQSFYQLNNDYGFELSQNSYFESQGDTVYKLDYMVLEDNIMSLARISTDLLPLGEFEILPSISYLASSHSKVKHYAANGSVSPSANGLIYEYEIPELRRSVKVHISNDNQSRILKWEETYPTVFDDVLRTSVYELKGVEVMPYWNLNSSEDTTLRKDFNLLY